MTKIYSGLELMHYAFKDQIKRNSDMIALFVHWYLVKNGFECIIDGKVYFFLFFDLKLKFTFHTNENMLESIFRRPRSCQKNGIKTRKYA